MGEQTDKIGKFRELDEQTDKKLLNKQTKLVNLENWLLM